jgi:NADH-quinone oxidoreductase subunit J
MISDAATTVLFYVLCDIVIGFAFAVVNARRLLRAALYLMGLLFTSAGLYLMLSAEFLAGVQVLVYVGGIVILIVFAVMLTSSADLLEDHPTPRRKILGAAASIGFLIMSGVIFWTAKFGSPSQAVHPPDDAPAIGKALIDFGPDGYVLPFEIVSLLLLAAVIGGIVVARKMPPRDQPFTSGGDAPGEAAANYPRSQREEVAR